MVRSLFAAFLCLFAVSASAQISVSPGIVNFFTVFQGAPDSINVTVTNNSGRQYRATDVGFHHTDAFWASETSFTINPGQSRTIKVYCDPRHNISYRDFLLIKSNTHPEVAHAFVFARGAYTDPYYDLTEDKWHEDLKTALKTIITFGYVNLGYTGARDQMFLFVDNHKQNGIGTVDNTIECVYTGTQAVGYTSRQDCQDNYNFNTEHVFPQSIFNEDPPMVADMHHLFPVTSGANSQRSNDPFGVVSNPSWTSGGSKSNGNTFEPRDEHKGAIARSLFYFVLRYQDFQNFVAPQEAVLRTWLLAHLPDSVEWNRNDDIYALQNNRNPFIDHPEFIERISSITGTASASPAPALHHVADTMAFASVVPGNDRDGQLVLSNQGDQDLTLSSFNFSDAAFTLLGSPSLTVPADSERVLTIRFSPTTASTDYSSTLTFSTNDPGNASVTVDLLGDTYPVSATAPDESEALFVYPVPATDLLMLRTSGQHDFHTAELIAADGRILRTQPLDSGHQQFGMNIATVRSGIYLLRVSGTEGRLVKKVWIK